MADLPELAAAFCAELRAAGVPVDVARTERFARAIVIVDAMDGDALYWCARATLIADPAHIPILDAVFGMVFSELVDPAEQRGVGEPAAAGQGGRSATADATSVPSGGSASAGRRDAGSGEPWEFELPALASDAEQLATRDFAELSTVELSRLADLMRSLRVRLPRRRSRRMRSSARGRSVDAGRTLRAARRTAAEPIRLVRRRPVTRPRGLVVLLDISGSMEQYSRAMLQLLYCASGAGHAEVFTFATRLTRLTRELRRSSPDAALTTAGRLAPDWSGGTRIADALREFLGGHGRRGMARGAVVVIVSDGWETGDPVELGTQMYRLSRLAFRIIWANPRTARPGYRPLAGGMAAAWPYCDAVVSAHRLDAIDELLTAIEG
jgi:uncharacterized protein with von Willebrand factor type A (vWA) domain